MRCNYYDTLSLCSELLTRLSYIHKVGIWLQQKYDCPYSKLALQKLQNFKPTKTAKIAKLQNFKTSKLLKPQKMHNFKTG